MINQLIECVPNFSEGRDKKIISQITGEIENIRGVRLIHVDPGKDTNRTVVTIFGTPEEVCEAAFRAVKKAAELIDMSKHHGEHPRIGATDVCPLVPYANISMDDVIVYARMLARRIGEELHIPVYCYGFAALEQMRRNLAGIRRGEYENLPQRLASREWKPDFGPAAWNSHTARTGVTAVGARNILVAYNVNLDTGSKITAGEIAKDVRESGRIKQEGNFHNGKTIGDTDGNPIYESGLLKYVQAIGWYLEEYDIAQVSMNLTSPDETPMHIAFETVQERALARGLHVTGSELVGLAPLKAILDAGRYFLHKENRSADIPEAEIIRYAVKSLGLDDLRPFDPEKKIIEYILKNKSDQ